MKARVVILAGVLVALLALGLVVTAWLSRPKIIEVYPASGALNIPSNSSIRLSFSRAMNAQSVQEHLKIEPATEGSFSWVENKMTFTPDRAWPEGGEIKLHLEAGARALNWLTFPLVGRDWLFTTSTAYLAYLWPSDGPADIYTLNPVTGEILQLTHEMGVLEYTLGKDGSQVYFSANNSQGGTDLYKYDRLQAAATGAQYRPAKLLDCGGDQCRSPVVSYDEKYLAYEYLKSSPEGGLSPAQIWVLELPSLTTTQIGLGMHETVQPAWSANGWLAYYDRTSSVYVMINPQTKEQVQLANQTGEPGNWSRDGKYYLAPEISYHRSSASSETGTSHLMLYNVQTAASMDLSIADNVEDVEGIYSPDGRLIAFARKFLDEAHWTLGRQIWIMSADGSNPHPITNAPDYNHYDLAWSEDGLKLAYVRFNQAKLSDPPELWIANVDGSDPLELVVGGYSPIWIP